MTSWTNSKASPRAMAVVAAAATAAIAACAVLGATGALTTAAQDRDVAASLDTVDIECESDLEGTVDYYDEPIARTVTVTNEGAACWVRCKTTLGQGEATADVAGGASQEGWKSAADGWTYRLAPLGEAEQASLTESVEVPEEWGRGVGVSVATVAQAVQAKNFEPDFEAESPWGDVEPERAVYARAGSEDGDEVGVQPLEGGAADDGERAESGAQGQEGGAQ